MCHTAEITHDVLRPVFEDRIISRRADVVWPSRSWDLTALDYYFWGAVKDKCYADKPETINALQNNIREAVGEIQLHKIDNVLKNWTSRCSHLNEIIQQFFLKHFFKNKVFGGPYTKSMESVVMCYNKMLNVQ